MHPTRFSSSLWSSLTSSSTTFRVNLLSSFVHHIVLFLFNLFLLLRNSPCVVFVAFSRPQGAGSRVREEKEKSVQEGKETAGNARLLFEHWKSRVRLSGPREKEPRKERQKRKKKKKRRRRRRRRRWWWWWWWWRRGQRRGEEGRRGTQHHPLLPFTSAILRLTHLSAGNLLVALGYHFAATTGATLRLPTSGPAFPRGAVTLVRVSSKDTQKRNACFRRVRSVELWKVEILKEDYGGDFYDSCWPDCE